MPTREQLTDERVRELITELGEAGIIHEDEAGNLTTTREFNEAREVRKSTPEPPAVSRAKVGEQTRQKFREHYAEGETDAAIAVIWEIITGENVRD